jgi:probable HAF family extracellular repeat protein
MSSRLLLIYVLGVLLAAGHASGAYFLPLGDVPGRAISSAAYDLSADSSVVVGTSGTDLWLGGVEPFRWTTGGGTVGLGNLTDTSNAYHTGGASAVSADGSIIVGGSRGEAFRWTSNTGMIGLGDPPGGENYSSASDVSADGSVVVGYGGSANGAEAFRWTSSTGMLLLGDLPGGSFYSSATDVSADGSVVVGFGSGTNGQEPFRWTSSGGMIGLGVLPAHDFFSTASGVSADGSVVVGESGSEAFRWTGEGGMVGLGYLSGHTLGSVANDVSADGSLIVGRSWSHNSIAALVWDAANGMRSVDSVLSGLGFDLPGWTLSEAAAISADGTSIVGYGINPSGQVEAWLANISAVPEPSAVPVIFVGVVAPVFRRRSRLRVQL